MAKRNLTDRTLKALKPAQTGHYDVMDSVVAGFGVRVSETGRRTFMLLSRYPGSHNPTRRALGVYGAVTLEKARQQARKWIDLIHRGIDPRDEEERQRRAEQLKRDNSFARLCEDFVSEKLAGERKGKEIEREIRREFLPAWGSRPVTEIADIDILPVIKAKAKTAPAQARNLLATAKRLFLWAIDQRVYGLARSPCDTLRPRAIVGEKVVGNRILTDDELFALWRAAKRMPYPAGRVYQILILTGLRLNEVADASRTEVDLAQRLWIIPAERMKGRNARARPHAVPLTDAIIALLADLPRFNGGDYLFTTTFGKSPVWMGDKLKKRLDARILRTLQAMVRKRGGDPRVITLPPWRNHDIRRTVRSGLSRLKIAEEAREAVLAHARPGIKGVYDLHDYLDEKREALELWGARVRSIVQPAPANVVQIATAKADHQRSS